MRLPDEHFHPDTNPAFWRQPGCLKTSATIAHQKIVGRIGRRRTKNRKVASSCNARRAGRKLRLVAVCKDRRSCRLLPCRDTRAVICNAASCAGVRLAEPPAHESPPAHQVLASAARTVRRPGSSNITASCVRAGVGAVTLAADPACAPGRAARAPACRHPSRPPLVWRIANKSARESQPCSRECRNGDGEKISG